MQTFTGGQLITLREALFTLTAIYVLPGAAFAGAPGPAPMGQNPSPMVEHTRAHTRLKEDPPQGRREKLTIGTLFLPAGFQAKHGAPLLIFFHGPAWISETAGARNRKTAVISIQIGSGSRVYENAFVDPKSFGGLLAEAERLAAVSFTRITLAGWSAGCAAIRQILSEPEWYGRVQNVILMDGIHAGYAEGKPGPLESHLETDKLQTFVKLGRDAMESRKHVLVTHSEIFPGTFASTTETADYLLKELGLQRKATLKWGPQGTQALSEARAGRFMLIGFAGNSAPDHVDQLHSLPAYLKWIR